MYRFAFILLILAALSVSASALPPAGQTYVFTVDVSKSTGVAPEIYGVGYNGWGDITYPQAIKHLKGVGVKFCRMEVNLKELCGDRLGDYRWEYTTPADIGVGFISRIRQIRKNGWTPILALMTSHALPKWFHGDPTDSQRNPWFKYNLDGSTASDGMGNQYEEVTRITHDLAAKLTEVGLRGQYWETIYELGHTMPLPDIHYYAAKGIKSADPSAKVMGPATWPGWTVEEKFVRPYLAKYGSDLLDFVSVHWYGSNEHELWDMGYKPDSDFITMADRKYLDYLMSMTTKYPKWCLTLRALLDDRKVNPSGKRIGIVFTEFDANAQSPYQHNPVNADWPKYRADADCYINTNYWGGVWCASVLCNLASTGHPDIVCKFNTRNYYGLIENDSAKGYYRQPVWFAWKLLRDAARLLPRERMVQVVGTQSPEARVGHPVEVYAVGRPGDLRLIVLNKTFDEQSVRINLRGLPIETNKTIQYLFDRSTTAPFIGRKSDSKQEGAFQGAPDDSINLKALKPVREIQLRREQGKSTIELTCPPVSMMVLTCSAPGAHR